MEHGYRKEVKDCVAEREVRPYGRESRIRRDRAMVMAGIGDLAHVVAVGGDADHALRGMADICPRLGGLGQL